eukprot:comp6174_c0_seq1/m.2001 comp6174_c0_seq1/g.2001  ORF comp6174_c0_seq1/g.2001 comp6174_c0_seq1/m.2001 type:complete len:284 (-) comp6174_c0_seq1:116-967(-)
MPTNEVISQALGYISAVCWLIVSFPQFYEIYQTKSGKGLSVFFLVLWTIGDILNLAGCIMSNQLATQLYVALWYMVMDTITFSMLAYYDWIPAWRSGRASAAVDGETKPLLKSSPVPTVSQSTIGCAVFLMVGMTGLFRFSKTQSNLLATTANTGRALLSTNGDDTCPYSHLVCSIGITLGWASSFVYLSARIPQIIQNFKRRSTDGLSIWLFVLAVAGNTTYAGSIFVWSTDAQFLWEKFPWILGSLGTLVFDFTIFGQFAAYSKGKEEGKITEEKPEPQVV